MATTGSPTASPVNVNVDLSGANSFGVHCRADEVFRLTDTCQLDAANNWLKRHPDALILGSGSNVLLVTQHLPAALLVELRGRRVLASNVVQPGNNTVLVEAASGENWHEFVQWTLDQGLFGLENLSLIPGTCGAAPIQNIGAYGVELADTLHSVQAMDRTTGQLHELNTADCQFAYRTSRFKTEPRKWLVVAIRLALHRQSRLQTGYGDIERALNEAGVEHPSGHDISRAVCSIRRSKLPDPAVLGNAGSFFKNPVLSKLDFELKSAALQDIPSWEMPNGDVKLAAGALIDACGFKGIRRGDAGIHEKHALVLVNHGNASGEDIWQLATEVQQAVASRFGVQLDPEPAVIRSA